MLVIQLTYGKWNDIKNIIRRDSRQVIKEGYIIELFEFVTNDVEYGLTITLMAFTIFIC